MTTSNSRAIVRILFALLLSFIALSVHAQTTETTAWTSDLGSRYWTQPDIVYNTANNTNLKLDVLYPHDVTTPTPTLVYIHGGGWIFGNKETSVLSFLPYLEMGWRVVNVEYRMAGNSLAPAAVEDVRCALRWVLRNAKQYNFDPNKIVVTGHSAGGHLALMAGMLTPSAGLDNQCYDTEDLKVAAIINWYGITDVNDLLEGPNLRNYAVMWLGSQTNREEIAKRISPLTYVRKDLPPILTIHGDKDDVVPYDHAVRLHKALDQAGVKNRLVRIPGGGHGGFSQADYVKSFGEIKAFLKQQGVIN